MIDQPLPTKCMNDRALATRVGFRLALMALAAVVLCGCAGYRPYGDSALNARLFNNKSQTERAPGNDIRGGRRAALAAFNVFYYADAAAAGVRVDRQEVTVQELRNLTDAMLHSFLTPLRKVPELELLDTQQVMMHPAYLLLPGNIGADLVPLPLGKGPGTLAAPYNLKSIQLHQSLGRRAMRREINRGDVFARMKGLWGGGEILAEIEDLGLLAEQLGVDFVVVVNNQVRFSMSPAGRWHGHLELVEVLIAGPSNLKKLAYAKHVKGNFIELRYPLAADPSDPETWALMRYTPVPDDPQVIVNPAGRDFASMPFWPQLAPPYRRVCQLFGRDLTRIRDLQ